jgi:hypothetical protein
MAFGADLSITGLIIGWIWLGSKGDLNSVAE